MNPFTQLSIDYANQRSYLDDLFHINGNNIMHKDITETYAEHNIMSALVLREFLWSV